SVRRSRRTPPRRAPRRARNGSPDPPAQPFFFFQAEDGIRGRTVTGVQTCALPISEVAIDEERSDAEHGERLRQVDGQRGLALARSEERRVGKECRSRWSSD